MVYCKEVIFVLQGPWHWRRTMLPTNSHLFFHNIHYISIVCFVQISEIELNGIFIFLLILQKITGFPRVSFKVYSVTVVYRKTVNQNESFSGINIMSRVFMVKVYLSYSLNSGN